MFERGLRFGPLHFTSYGLCAASGLVAAMALVRRCARCVELDPEMAWDAGLFAIFSCFAASRLLLILQSPRAFLHYPLLLLGLPSLTLGGLAVAAAMTWAFLRRKHLPLLPLLDVFAAPGAVLAAFLELGHWLDGSGTGMPTRLPWGVAVPGGRAGLKVQPEALYGAMLALALGAALWLLLAAQAPRRALQLPFLHRSVISKSVSCKSVISGRVVAVALLVGGLEAFGLDMISMPLASTMTPGIEPGQWAALATMLAGALLWSFTSKPTRAAVPAGSPLTEPLHMEVH